MSHFDDGWIRVSRSLLSVTHDLHPQSTDEPACRLAAWLDMIGMARWRPGAGLQRGEFRGSVRYLAARWNWSNGRAHRFVQYLIEEDRITMTAQPGRKPSIVSICNYDKYQLLPDGVEYATGPPSTQTQHKQVHISSSGHESSQADRNTSEYTNETRTGTRTSTKKKEEEERRIKKSTRDSWMEHFNRTRKAKLPRTNGLSLTAEYRRKMDARIAEGLTEQDGLRAIDGAFAAEQHRDTRWKYVTPELIFRSQGHVERFESEAPRRNGDSRTALPCGRECVSCLETFTGTGTLCPECSEKPAAEVDASEIVKSLTGRM